MTRQVVKPGQFVKVATNTGVLPQVYEVVCQVQTTPPPPIQPKYEGRVSSRPENHSNSEDPRRARWAREMANSRIVGTQQGIGSTAQWWLRRVEDAGTSNFVRAYASSLVVVGSVFHDAGVEDRQTLLSRINNAPLAPGQEPRRVQESWPVEARVENRVVVRRRGRLYSIKEDSAEDIVLFDEEAKSGHNVFRTKKAALEALNKEKK